MMTQTGGEPHSMNGYDRDVWRLRWRATICVRNLYARIVDDDGIKCH